MAQADEAFETELRLLIPRLRRFGHAITGSIDEGDDLVQEALERSLTRKAQFRAGTRLDSWIYKIMQNCWIDRKRSAVYRHSTGLPDETLANTIGEDGRNSYVARIALRQVRIAMARLHIDERLVLAAVSIDGQSYREAAETLDLPIGTVMSRLARARRKLLEALDGMDD